MCSSHILLFASPNITINLFGMKKKLKFLKNISNVQFSEITMFCPLHYWVIVRIAKSSKIYITIADGNRNFYICSVKIIEQEDEIK